MCLSFYVCFLLALNMLPTEGVSISLDTMIRTEGIFTKFVRALLDLLIKDFPEDKLDRYCRVLYRHLRQFPYSYAHTLAKLLRRLSRMYRPDIKDELRQYRKDLDQELVFRKQFLDNMNQVFNLKEAIQFNKYIAEMRRYGKGEKTFIDEETSKMLNTIIYTVTKIARTDPRELERKLKKAIKEYFRLNKQNKKEVEEDIYIDHKTKI